MFNLFNPQNHSHRRGQIAVIIVLVVAVLFIFFSVILNLGRVAQIKTQTTVAANVTAAYLASEMASYSEYLYRTYLGGPGEVEDHESKRLTACKSTSVLITLLTFIVVLIIVAVITIVTGGTGTSFAIAASISLVTTLLTIGIQLTFIEPTISGLWNKIFKEMKLDQPTQFLESGLQTGLQNIVSDQRELADTEDYDTDLVWDGGVLSGDLVSRFSRFYTQRLLGSLDTSTGGSSVNWDTVDAFRGVLEEFIGQGSDGWGIWDPASRDLLNPCGDNDKANNPAECTCCCLPKQWCSNSSFGGCSAPDRPDYNTADNIVDEPNERASCCDSPVPMLLCGTTGSCPAPLAGMDPNDAWYRWVYDPYYESATNSFISFREFIGHDDEYRGFRNDGNNRPSAASDPAYPFRPRDANGFYALLWKMDKARVSDNPTFWCSVQSGNPDVVTDMPDNIGCVETTIDSLPGFSGSIDYAYGDGDCSTNDFTKMQWKKGSDRFCSRVWPYNQNCPGQRCAGTNSFCKPTDVEAHKNDQCGALSGNEKYWRSDTIDVIRYQMDEFIKWANGTLTTLGGANSEQKKRSFGDWYPEAKVWLEGNASGDVDHVCSGKDSKLCKWLTQVSRWKTVLENWYNNNAYPTVGGYICSRSSVADTISCLDSKINELQSCNNSCDADHCSAITYPAWPGSCTAAYRTSLQNIKTRFIYRRDFLVSVADTITQLETAKTKLRDFIVSSQAVLAQGQVFQNTGDLGTRHPKLSNFVIYGWQDENLLCGPGASRGCWHIVQVEARIPTLCGGKCGRKDPYFVETQLEVNRWPRIKTYTTDFLDTSRCESLGDSFDNGDYCNEDIDYENWKACYKGGTTKARIIRYDENRDLSLKFANAVPIWKFSLTNPQRGPAGQSVLDALAATCDPQGEGAFMINYAGQSPGCHTAAKEILTKGVMTESCAEYFFHRDPVDKYKDGFNIKFSKCEGDF